MSPAPAPVPVLASRPVIAPPGRWRFPLPDRHRLRNGATVLLHHLPGQYAAVITCHLGIPVGAEPAGKDGIAAVTAACLGPATAFPAGDQFEQAAAAQGISWDASAGVTGPVITLGVPATRIPAALTLLARALTGPHLNPAEAARITGQAASGLMRAIADPPARALRELPALIYGEESRAGRPADGTPGTVAALTPADIAAFRDAWVRPASLTVVIAGDLGGLDAAAVAAQALGGWEDPRPPGGTAEAWPLPRRAPAAVLVDQPGAVQAQIQLAATVPSRGEPGSAEMRVAAWILGAPVTGLLDAQVRELAGHSYGIRATVTELTPGTGLFTAGGAVGAGGAVTALETIRAIIAGVLEDGFTAAEHAAAAEALTRTLPLAYETPAAVAAITTDLAVAGLPPGYTDLVLDDIAMLHPGHVTGTARRHLGPDQLSLIAVGDAATLAGPLQDLWGTAPLQVTRP